MIFSKCHVDNFDKISLSKTLLDSIVPISDGNITMNWYSQLNTNDSHHVKRGGCMYFMNFLPLIKRNDLTNMKECPVNEVNKNKEKHFFTCH